jgi:hypothetical protein
MISPGIFTEGNFTYLPPANARTPLDKKEELE